jgi:RNA polymerase sigma-70 factor (ECF subfamily)
MEDVARFEAVFETNHDRLLAYALARTDVDTAKEVVADVFLVAWRRLAELPAEPLPWLLGTARKTLATARRSTGRRDALADRVVHHRPVRAAGDPADGVVERAAALAALGHLSPPDRELLCLLAWDGLTPAEAAESLGCSTSTFAVRLHRARRRFDAALAAEDAAPPTVPDPALEDR